MTQSDPINTDSPVHEHFELSYASYKVLPRTVLQSMPVWWQRAFVDLMDLLDEAGADLPATAEVLQQGPLRGRPAARDGQGGHSASGCAGSHAGRWISRRGTRVRPRW